MQASPEAPAPSFDPEEAWKTLAAAAPDLDVGATLTAHAYAQALRTEVAAPTMTIPELPLLAVAEDGAPGDADFEVSGVLGVGGMGKVLCARQRSLCRDVALKMIKTEGAAQEVLESLLVEAVVTGSIEHPNVIPVHALGRDAAGRPVLVMKRVEGVSWDALAKDPDHPAWALVAPDAGDRLDAHLEILMAVCNAVHFAHSRGIVHRDLKLENVMIGGFGEVYVVDWGVALRQAAKAEAPRNDGLVLITGTPAYMAPEMVLGDPSRIDARTDVYLLGATLHHVLTGSPRHRGKSLYDVLVSARLSPAFAYGPEVPAELAAIGNRAMSLAAADRFSSALELRRALAGFRRHRGSIALSDEAASRMGEIEAIVRREPGAEKDDRRVHALMTECRFGFVQALREWPENAAAQKGLGRCLEAMIDHELAQRDVAGARALAAELDGPRPDVERRIEALVAELRDEAARAARLQAFARDQDFSIGARAQLAIVAVPLVFSAVMIAYVVRGDIWRAQTPTELIAPPAIALVLLALVVKIVWRRLQTSISRRAILVLTMAPASLLVHRILATAQGVSFAGILGADLVIGAVLAGAMGIVLMPRVGWIVLVDLACAVVTAIRPDLAQPVFALGTTSTLLLLLALWRRTARG